MHQTCCVCRQRKPVYKLGEYIEEGEPMKPLFMCRQCFIMNPSSIYWIYDENGNKDEFWVIKKSDI